MSTYWYFECLDHTPPLRSADEFTQHTDDYAFRQAIALATQRPINPEWWDSKSLSDDYFSANACRFLVAHPACRLGLVNEYNERRELDPAVPMKDEGTN